MAKIYVAGKNIERAQKMMNTLRENGHVVIFDWITDITNEKDPLQKAKDEREAVKQSEVLVYLYESDQESARYEVGMAMGLHKPIIVSNPRKNAFFLSLPEIISVENDTKILSALNKII